MAGERVLMRTQQHMHLISLHSLAWQLIVCALLGNLFSLAVIGTKILIRGGFRAVRVALAL